MILSVDNSTLAFVILASIAGGAAFGATSLTTVWVHNRPINRLGYATRWLKTAIDYRVPALLRADQAQMAEIARLDTLDLALPFGVHRGSLAVGFLPRVDRWAVLSFTNTGSLPLVYRCIASVTAARGLVVGWFPQWSSDEFIQAFAIADLQQQDLEEDFRVSISTQRPKSI